MNKKSKSEKKILRKKKKGKKHTHVSLCMYLFPEKSEKKLI